MARKNREKQVWGPTVDIVFKAKSANSNNTNTSSATDTNFITLSATKPVTTPIQQNPWFGIFRANLI
eukprot:CAMPEP_0194153226 /NCGR_PEP_ID=MMETSP0152-20130528/55624_1 /TAXON_ID=1049557 /ORGANISM="Thalassiothrix antarctica, Strain L6-D1" /LENGTH=66 /DNA_ID=CAMNT_0038858371 /DNA_START=271 /DNA_END=468 /DNA_ORIENTATION=-